VPNCLVSGNGDRKVMKNFLGWEHTPKISNQLINKINIQNVLNMRIKISCHRNEEKIK
jgi:hypothetical protein